MSKRILIVDDEDSIRQIMAEMLTSLGYEVEEAEDGEGALALLKLDFDLVLSDMDKVISIQEQFRDEVRQL